MAEKSQVKLPSGQAMIWKDRDYPSVYANLMGIGMTPFDISVVFGEIGDTSPTEVTGIPKVKITLSPEQAANLVKLLAVTLTKYTEGNGLLRSAGAVNVEELYGSTGS